MVDNQAAPARPRPVPWRNSKLTMLLKRSLTGNSCTAMIFTISPAVWCVLCPSAALASPPAPHRPSP